MTWDVRAIMNVEAVELRGYLERSPPFRLQKTTIEEIPDEDEPVSIFDTNDMLRHQRVRKSSDFGPNSLRPDLG
ncbi:hypothetical protein F4604DRAFT_1912847 [Suillus subluteus]|nr:hypothetical protein F4604DRAFT_1912847 [Suillus subluteus]